MRIDFSSKAHLPSGGTTEFLGRNGMGRQHGLEIFEMNHLVVLTPITSKGSPARCSMEIPLDGEILEQTANELLRIAASLETRQASAMQEEPR